MRRLPPQVRAELAQLDAALVGGSGDSSLDALVGEMRALRPAMTPTFAQALETRVATGFPGEARTSSAASVIGWAGRAPSAVLRAGRSHLWTGGLAATAVAATVAVVVVAGSGPGPRLTHGVAGGASSVRRTPTAAVTSTPPHVTPADQRPFAAAGTSAGPSAAAGTSAGASAGAAAPAPATPPTRQQQQSASLALTTSGSVQDVADGVVRVAGVYGGYVQSSQISDNGGRGGQATLALAIPSTRLGAALQDISRLAHLQSRNQSVLDITGTYDSARRQLSDAVAQRQALLRALARATTTGQIDSIKYQLQLVGGRIDQYRRDFDAVSRQAHLAQVTVTVTAAAHKTGASTLGGAADDAGRVLAAAAGGLLIAAAVLVPLAALVLAGGFGARALRRGRRQRALDALL